MEPLPENPTDEQIDSMASAIAERDGITLAEAREQVLAQHAIDQRIREWPGCCVIIDEDAERPAWNCVVDGDAAEARMSGGDA